MSKIHVLIYVLLTILFSSVVFGAITDNIYASYSYETQLQDDSDGQNNYSEGGGVLYVTNSTCKVGNSCHYFDGTDDYLGVNNEGADAMDGFDDNYTISMWVYNILTTSNLGIFDSEGRVASILTNNATHYYYNTYSGGDHKVYAPYTINTWEHFIFWYNSTDQRVYKNNVLIDSVSGLTDDGQSRVTRIGSGYNGNYFRGFIDQTVIWRRAITTSERASIYNGGNEYDPFDPTPITSSLDILFLNSTSEYTSSLGEGEDFDIFLNYTLTNGTILTNDTAVCNVSVFNGITELKGDYDNFTLCDSGCNFSSRSKEFTLTSTNAINDSLHFDGCHEQTATGNVEINVSCTSGSEILTVLAAEMPLCSLGTAFIRKSSSVCVGDGVINVSTDTAGNIPFSQRKRVLNTAFDREYSEDVNEATYNLTSTLWGISHEHEFYSHGNKTVNASCIDTTYSKNASEQITIVNAAPTIFIEQVNTSLGITALSEGVTIQYADGVWNWFGAVIDDDLDTLNVSWYNSSGYNMLSFQGDPMTTSLNTTDGLFVDFQGNSFSINITVNDTQNANATASISFIVNDTLDPVCTLPTGYSGSVDTEINVSFTCTDENLFSVNVTCPNSNFTNTTTGLNVESFTGVYNISSIQSDTCSVRYCDGHTKNNISLKALRKEQNVTQIISNGFVIGTVWIEKGDLEFEEETDRLRFKVDFDADVTSKSVFYQTSEDAVYLESNQFVGWVVSQKHETWFDMNNLINAPVVTINHGGGLFEFVLLGSELQYEFESIGELNCVTDTFTITVTNLFKKTAYNEFTSTQQAFFWMFILAFWLVLLVLTLTIKGRHGRTVQLLNIFQAFVGVSVGLGWMRWVFVIGLAVVIAAAGTFIGLSMED